MKCNDNMFVDFISKCLVWNPKKRIKPIDALMHMFILEGLPSSIRE
jgi:dual specificity tyrosine-phosphorylation-regulated kinase 2/3/4